MEHMEHQEHQEMELREGNVWVALTKDSLDVKPVMDFVRNPGAGAIVIFAGQPASMLANLISPLTSGHRHDQGQLRWKVCERAHVLSV
jgi:hypothetical protein